MGNKHCVHVQSRGRRHELCCRLTIDGSERYPAS